MHPLYQPKNKNKISEIPRVITAPNCKINKTAIKRDVKDNAGINYTHSFTVVWIC